MKAVDKVKQPQFGRRAETPSNNSTNSSSSVTPSSPPPVSTTNVLIPYNKINFTGEILGEGGFGVVKK